jgi:hypothetical protein
MGSAMGIFSWVDVYGWRDDVPTPIFARFGGAYRRECGLCRTETLIGLQGSVSPESGTLHAFHVSGGQGTFDFSFRTKPPSAVCLTQRVFPSSRIYNQSHHAGVQPIRKVNTCTSFIPPCLSRRRTRLVAISGVVGLISAE